MRKLTIIMWVLLAAVGISACSGAPVKPANSPEQQRSHSRDAQDELSTDIKR